MKKRIGKKGFALMMGALSISAVNAWQHPGVLVSKAQLDFVTQQVNAHAEPFYSDFLRIQASNQGKKTYTVKGPWSNGINQCGSYSNPDQGCSAADSDSAAAYLQALLWYVTGDSAYAKNAITIMNTYATRFKGFAGFLSGHPCPGAANTCSNAPLQAAWDTEKWARAAEIIRYGHGGTAGWSSTEIAAFSTMLKNVYQPLIYNGSKSNGNWELSMIEGMMGIAVFNEDRALLQRAQAMWKKRIPAYFYNYNLDNPLYPGTHAPFPSTTGATWNGQTVFNASTTGVSQETCRDLGHTEFGISAAISAAETDYIQSDQTANLYGADGAPERLITSLNLMAGLELAASTVAPAGFCTGAGNRIILGRGLTYVMGYNHYHNRLKDPRMADKTGTSGLHGSANTWQWIHNGLIPNKYHSDPGNHIPIYELFTHYANADGSTPGGGGDVSVTIQANSQSMVQGSSLPALTWTATPAVSLTTAPVCRTAATSNSPVGTYPINCTGAVKSGYVFQYVPGTLTVTAPASSASCVISSAAITAQEKWGNQTVNRFSLSLQLNGFPAAGNQIKLDGILTMKNAFIQNFWGNFSLSPSYTGAVGKFTGTAYSKTITLQGYIDNQTALSLGGVPHQAVVLNGIVCR